MNYDQNNTREKIDARQQCEDICELLRLTNDGNKLAPKHLSLVQLVCNGDASELGISEFYNILNQARDGKYDASKIWLHGIEHMTIDSVGYVMYKGKHVEHFTRRAMKGNEELIKTIQLQQVCTLLERKGIEVDVHTAVWTVEDHLTPEELAHCEIVLQLDEDQIVGIGEFLRVNSEKDVMPLTYEDILTLKGLGVNQSATLGGGAQAQMIVKRIA